MNLATNPKLLNQSPTHCASHALVFQKKWRKIGFLGYPSIAVVELGVKMELDVPILMAITTTEKFGSASHVPIAIAVYPWPHHHRHYLQLRPQVAHQWRRNLSSIFHLWSLLYIFSFALIDSLVLEKQVQLLLLLLVLLLRKKFIFVQRWNFWQFWWYACVWFDLDSGFRCFLFCDCWFVCVFIFQT